MRLSQILYNYFIPRPLEMKNQPLELESNPTKMKSGNNTPICGIPSILDASVRGIGRAFETGIDSYGLRLVTRFVTENVRYASSRPLLNWFQGQKTNLDVFFTGLLKSIEITGGSAITDPNREPSMLIRMVKGFFNQVGRVVTRSGLTGLKFLSKKQDEKSISWKSELGVSKLADEFLSRVVFRVFDVVSDYKIITAATRTFSQFLINEWLRNLPLLAAYKFNYCGMDNQNKEEPDNHELNQANTVPANIQVTSPVAVAR